MFFIMKLKRTVISLINQYRLRKRKEKFCIHFNIEGRFFMINKGYTKNGYRMKISTKILYIIKRWSIIIKDAKRAELFSDTAEKTARVL